MWPPATAFSTTCPQRCQALGVVVSIREIAVLFSMWTSRSWTTRSRVVRNCTPACGYVPDLQGKGRRFTHNCQSRTR